MPARVMHNNYAWVGFDHKLLKLRTVLVEQSCKDALSKFATR